MSLVIKSKVEEIMEENPFKLLKLTDSEFLNDLSGRKSCPVCKKSRKFFCYTCYVPVEGLQDQVPLVKLPFKVDIIKHPNECDGKSTSAHAGVISPGDVTIYTYPCIPDYDKDKVVLLFPCEDSISLEELKSLQKYETVIRTIESEKSEKKEECSQGVPSVEQTTNIPNGGSSKIIKTDGSATSTYNSDSKRKCDLKEETINSKKVKLAQKTVPFERAVFIDSTWNQTKRICMDERLKGLQRVEIKSRNSHFWRHQKDIPTTYLSTIEAIYYFVRDSHDLFVTSEYNGEYDNLLFFFNYMYKKIRNMYSGGGDLKAYKQRGKVT